jgi:nucleoside-diphosphate-sugar epimerase
MRSTILVTGATGFIGQHLVAALRDAGTTVHTHSQRDGHIASSPLDYDGIERVVHLAAKTFVPDSWNTPGVFYETNVLGTVNVLELCRRSNASLTFVSSYVYGHPRTLPIGEDHPVQAFNPYGHSKIVAEDVVRYYAATFQVPAAIVRPFNVFGDGQAAEFLIPTVIRQVLDPSIEAVTVQDLRPRRDYIHVDDLVALLMATVATGAQGTFNAGSGRSASVGDIIAAVERIAAIDKPIRCTGHSRPDEVLDVIADVSRAERELGWRPKITLEEGLARTIGAMRSEVAGPS